MTKRARFNFAVIASLTVIVGVIGIIGILLFNRASSIQGELNAASQLVPGVKEKLLSGNSVEARQQVKQMQVHTGAARDASSDPLWTLASSLPWGGQNFQAVSQVASSADDLVRLGAEPLADVLETVDWQALAPNAQGVDLGPISSAAPKLESAANAIRQSSDRLQRIEIEGLVPEVAEPLVEARNQVALFGDGLDVASDAASIAPLMMGSQAPRRYLLLIQNNAESRSTGGIPGALAVLTVDSGRLTLSDQTNSGGVGVMSPPIPVDAEQQQIYSGRLGKFMQDVNLTPDFPSVASTAIAMWKVQTKENLDGVIAVDPVALGYVLDATGPVELPPTLQELGNNGLPSQLTSENVVSTLLSAVYMQIAETEEQDAYFAGVAQAIFTAVANGQGDSTKLLNGVTRGTDEGRIRLWSKAPEEQRIIERHRLGGAIAGPSVSPAEFGIYFNDGTGAKMDFYVKRTVQLLKECPGNGYHQTTVRVTSTNTAPQDASESLPAYVTGNGYFGIPAGSVQTNIVAYGPAQANVETAKLDGQKIEFAPHLHGSRPVGVLAVRLAPGESKTVDFTFGKIVQHTEPTVVVTPTVQDVTEVTLPTQIATCG